MEERIAQLLVFAITGFIFMTISVSFGWSRKLWSLFNKKIDQHYNIVIWILFAGILTILIHLLFIAIGLPYYRIIKGFVLGIYLAAMPNIDDHNENNKKDIL